MAIINGTFEVNLDNWTAVTSGNADVIWDNGRARLRVYRCSSARMEQIFLVDNGTLIFDYQSKADDWHENIYWELRFPDGTLILQDGFPISRAGNYIGTKTVDLSDYIGDTIKIIFYITPSSWCDMHDHFYTYLWVDNIRLAGPNITARDIVPSTTYCIGQCDVTVDVTWQNIGEISGTFEPGIIVGERPPIRLEPETLEPGLSVVKTFTITALTRGPHMICPEPN